MNNKMACEMRNPMRIGITGGIAAGKSTVVAHMRELGAFVLDYDGIAAEVVAPDTPGLRKIVSAFGPEAIDNQGQLRRKWLSSVIFGGAEHAPLRERLNAIVHPLVYERAAILETRFMQRLDNGIDSRSRIIIHDIPLLTEVIRTIPFDFRHIITVEAPVDLRIQRMLSSRHMSMDDAQARIQSQSNEHQRLDIADIVIDSAVSIEQMFETVDRVYAGLVQEQQRSCDAR
ncbi:MAG: dephospho-CoA kinase [Bifidobacterium aquikefiri]|uniref:Dephospho-CoA kinase n=2 Tax=Bifidobacterium aquikefiri TaxID=1653207 RepID=A0A261G6K1_9BIFI|nr:dephospho-CoA kinase [Bifidobacterium aquikefiri]OZG66833.1 dephospho-CoA kinase [Bifidobacterium aquikefiri]